MNLTDGERGSYLTQDDKPPINHSIAQATASSTSVVITPGGIPHSNLIHVLIISSSQLLEAAAEHGTRQADTVPTHSTNRQTNLMHE